MSEPVAEPSPALLSSSPVSVSALLSSSPSSLDFLLDDFLLDDDLVLFDLDDDDFEVDELQLSSSSSSAAEELLFEGALLPLEQALGPTRARIPKTKTTFDQVPGDDFTAWTSQGSLISYRPRDIQN